jgi:nucleoside-diphosphate-sugar epimerase
MVTLVTGSTGFVGQYLVKQLLADEKRQVKCLARKNSNIGSLKKLGAEIVFGDITKPESLTNATADVDVVYHTAGYIETGFRQHYDKLYKTNVEGTRNLLEASAKGNLKKFVYFSSMGAIGTRNVEGLVKEDVACEPDTQYGKSKCEAEKVVSNYFNESGLPVVIIRPSTVYGPGEKHNFLTLTRAVKNRKFMFIGDGSNLTSLCYVDNLVDAVVLAEKKGANGGVYHVADGRPYSWKEIVLTIERELGIKVRIMHIPLGIARMGGSFFEGISRLSSTSEPPLYSGRVKTLSDNFAFNITKAKEELGYVPRVSFEEGLRLTIQWYGSEGLLS